MFSWHVSQYVELFPYDTQRTNITTGIPLLGSNYFTCSHSKNKTPQIFVGTTLTCHFTATFRV